MADYKIVDAKKLDADLTSVANAIRKKAGTTAKMEFPAGFESAVKNIPSGGAELPELGDTAAQPTDIALGKVLYDDKGNPVTGTLAEWTPALMGLAKQPDSVSESIDHSEIQITSGMYNPMDFIGRSTLKFRARVPASLLGNATANQVAKGATFTSAAGLLVEGTHECEGGVELPELGDTAAQASDMAVGKVLYDDDGTPVTGTLEESEVGTNAWAADDVSLTGTPGDTTFHIGGVYGKSNIGSDTFHGFICRPGTGFWLRNVSTSMFGNATANQVAKGATFTSADGLLVPGTLPDGGVLTLYGGTPDIYIEMKPGKPSVKGLTVNAKANTDRIIRAGDEVSVGATYDKFGNATAADVAKGKTFTSAAGWLVKGEHECEGGVELPELGDAAAQPTDIVSGKVLYDDDGNPVTGELDEVLEGRTIAAREFMDISKNGDNIETRAVMNIADVVVRKNAVFRTYAPASAFGNATADQVAKGATFTSASGLLVVGTMEAASGGGLAVKKGSTSSTTIDTGLSSIDYVVLLADSFSGTGLLQLLYRKPNNAISYILCTSYSYNSQKNELNHASMASSTLLTIDGGKVTWNGTGTSAFMSGASYMWLAFGTE